MLLHHLKGNLASIRLLVGLNCEFGGKEPVIDRLAIQAHCTACRLRFVVSTRCVRRLLRRHISKQLVGARDIMSRPDYLVATALPYMQLVHEDESDDRWKNFTVEDARQLYLDGLPLLINHNDGDVINEETGERAPLIEIGRIRASTVTGANAKILATIDPRSSEDATYASNAIAKGSYEDVSLGHGVAIDVRHAADGIVTYIKTPREVSVCKRGARYGSHIDTFCPGRATIERLVEHAPDDLAAMVDRHGYKQQLIDLGVEPTDKKRYIEVLVTLSDNRLAQVIESERLHSRPLPPQQTVPSPPTMSSSVKASDQQEQQSLPTEPIEQEAAVPAAAAAPEQKEVAPPVAEQQQPDVNRSVSTPAVSKAPEGDIPPHEWAKLATESQAKVVDAKKELAEQRVAFEKAQAELEQARKDREELAAIKAKEKEKRKASFEDIVKSYLQHAAAARTPKEEMDETVSSARDMLATNPDASMGMIGRAMKMAVRASETTATAEAANAAKMKAMSDSINNNFYSDHAKQYRAFLAAEAALEQSSYPAATTTAAQTTSFSSRFESAPASKAPETPASFYAEPEAAAPAPARKRMFADYVEKEAPVHFSVKASEGGLDELPIIDELRQNILHTTGKHASMSQLAYGEYYEATGKVQMSDDGRVEEPVVERKRLRRTRNYVTPWNYAPRFGDALDNALQQVSGRARFDGKFRMTMTEQGPQV